MAGARAIAMVGGSVVGLAIAFVYAACGSNVFACSTDDECADAGEDGTCEATGFCSFPDGECPSGARYGSHAGDSLAGECVPLDAGTTGGDDDGPPGSSDTIVFEESADDPDVTTDPDPTTAPTSVDESTTDIPVTCGDGELDPGEDCDDANLLDGDGCNHDCTPSGELIWQVVEDGPAALADGAASIDIGPDDALYIGAWFTDDVAPELAARKMTIDGDIEWTTLMEGPTQWNSVLAWGIAVDERGRPAIAGHASVEGGAEWVVVQLDAEGQVVWQAIEAGEAYGLDIGESVWVSGKTDTNEGRILGYSEQGEVLYRFEGAPEHPVGAFGWDVVVATGVVTVAGVVDVQPRNPFVTRVSPTMGVLSQLEMDASSEQALAIALADDTWWLVGHSDAQDAGWLASASIDLDAVTAPVAVTTPGSGGNLHGIAIGPSGEIVVVGWELVGSVLEAFVAKLTPEGELVWSRTYDAGTAVPDSARDVVVASDGTIVVAGHAGVLGSGDFWVFALTP
jgi:cysteine-rich repeat protein